MAEVKQELSIRGENIQRIYNFYRSHIFLVNRKYQRKLVWNIEEKASFVDSLIKGYPVPLFLLAEVEYEENTRFEIIDGMQRLNAITSFIDQEFDIEGKFFDLETMVETKLLLDKNEIKQNYPKLDRNICTEIASYVLPLSIYKIDNQKEIDEIFRRINSGGKQLSRQEIRQSNSLGVFANTVRKIASKIRGDDSSSDKLLLNTMKNISISNRKLTYGIDVDEIFWVKQYIIPREKVRQSIDEEIIADILGYILLDRPTSSSDLLDNYYGYFENDKTQQKEERYNDIEKTLSKNPEEIINNFIIVYEELRKVLNEVSKPFNQLIMRNASASNYVPRHFQVVFLAFYELLTKKDLVINDYKKLAEELSNIGSTDTISISPGGQWSGKSRKTNVEAVKGVIINTFRKRRANEDNPAIDSWTIRLENILMQSLTEQALFDFKQGFHKLDNIGDFDMEAFHKIVKTLTAMANHSPNVKGYVIVGVADNQQASERVTSIYQTQPIIYNKFYVSGIEGELGKYHNNNADNYYNYILDRLKKEPIIKGFLDQYIFIRLIKYYDKAIILFEVKANDTPVLYGNKYYIRRGSNTEEVLPEAYANLFKKFFRRED